MLHQWRWTLVGAMTALHSAFDSLMSDNACEMKEVTGQVTSHALLAIASIRLSVLTCETRM